MNQRRREKHEIFHIREGVTFSNGEALTADDVVCTFNRMFKQIFPNVTTGIIIQASQQIGVMILMQAVFAFLGLGVLPPAPSWGHMISAGRDYLTVYPWMAIVPGVALMITAIAFNFLGDGVRDVLDPKRTVV